MSSLRQLGEVLAAAKRTGVTADVTVKVDTGLSRNGAGAAEYPGDADGAARGGRPTRRSGCAASCRIWRTATTPTTPQRPAGAAADRDAGAGARQAACSFEIAHLSNSPAAMTRPDLAYDLVRPGIAVYGLTPIPERGDMGLRPAMTLKCPVALVRSVRGRRRCVLRAHLDRRP